MNVIDIAAIERIEEARMGVLRSASATRDDECCMMLTRRLLAGCIYPAVVREVRRVTGFPP
ncbi:hypothetical protein J8J40_29280, partial [Mycobacterium tuberculosis]|nr:hypothetical protein [Mycobacterium tuberculosis]